MKLWNIRKLSPRGMPRPIATYVQTHSHLYRAKKLKRARQHHLPVPWTQDTSWGTLESVRASEAQEKSLCLLCGRKVYKGVVLLSNENRRGSLTNVKDCYYPDDLTLMVVTDNAPLHERCGKLTMAHCPILREAGQRGAAGLAPYSNKRPKALDLS